MVKARLPARQYRLSPDQLWLIGLCASRVGFTLIFMTYAATLPLLQADWSMTAGQAGLIHSGFHLGYLISLFGVGFLADRFGAKRVILLASVAAAVSAFSFALFANGFLSGYLLYGATALFSGGSYTPVLTIIAQRFDVSRRGRAMGFYIAASSLGYAGSLFLSGLMMEVGGWRAAFYVTGGGPALGAILAFLVLRNTPNVVPPLSEGEDKGNLWREVLGNKPAMLIICGYTFHSWELLGLRAWIPAFLAASLAVTTGDRVRAASLGAAMSALMYAVSIGGNIMGGSLSDRWGRTAVIMLMGTLSLICSFTFGWMISSPFWLVVMMGLIYNFTAIGDSPVYSTALTELVNPRFIGAAYSLRSVLGFGTGVISPVIFGLVLDGMQGGGSSAGMIAWGLAFASLGLGGLLGPVAMAWLRSMPESAKMAGGMR
ncbi:MAG: MFS transporter [Candidatus Binatia bacterium]